MAYQPTEWEHGDIITGGKLNKIEEELTHVADNATYGFGGAQLSSDGLTPLSYINAGDPMPANPQKGDTVFLKDGNDFLIYSYNGEDWALKVDPDLSNRIEETIKTASDNTDKANADNNTQINETINQVAKEQADLAVKDGDFNNKAQAMADKALKDAKDNTATVAKSTLDTANKNIADAKKSLTDNIAKEVSDRASAVSALDTKAQGYADDAKKSATDGIAQEAKDRATAVSTVDKSAKGYADQAKQDAVDVATSADGVINKKIDDTASSLTSTISQNKIDANGKISTAQSTATQALNGLSTKVEKTDYDKKTGDLTTQLNTTTATATQSKQDIVDIKSTNSSQDSKINSIVSDATKTQQTISDIQKSQSTQSDKLNQITTDVNGTKQEITDIKTKDDQQDTRMGTIETSVSGVKSDFSTYKTDANGRISTAQTTAQTAVDGLKTKVSQTDYNAKTGQLSTDVTNVTQTANQAKTDIASIKQTDTKQDARMTTIEADADGTKTTVSNLQKTQNTQSGSISTLQQRADGFDATVTKVDNLSVGGRNYFLNSSGTSLDGWNQTSGWTTVAGTNRGTVFTIKPTATWNGGNYNAIYQTGINIPSGTQVTVSFWAKASVNGAKFHSEPNGSYSTYNPTLSTSWTRYSYTFTLTTTTIYFMGVDAGTIYYLDDMKIETGNIATDWTPAPEDVDSATAKAQLTADQATTALNNYKINADGRITKAQSDITQTAKDVTTKVSQSDYDKKTGDLSTSVSKAQQTADSAVTTIGNYKTSNDNRVKATETSIAQNTKDITLRATSTDLDSAKKDYNAQIAQVKVNADSITNQVSSIQTKINSMGQVNQLANTEFNPDYSGWYTKYPNPTAKDVVSTQFTNVGTDGFGSNMVSHKGNGSWIASSGVPVTPGMKLSFSARFFAPKAITSGGTPIALYIMAYDANGNRTLSNGYNVPVPGLSVSSNTYKLQNVTIPDKSVIAYAIFAWNVTDEVYISQPMLVFGSTVGDYVPGAYNSNDKVALQQITIDGITNTVSKQGTNIDSVTKRVQTAEGTLSTATDNISGLQTKQTTTANQVTQEITDRTKGDANTLQSSKDFTQSSITSYDKGVQTQLTQTSDAILAKVGATNLFPNSEFDIDYGYRAKSGKTILSLATKNNIDGAYNGTVSVTSTAATYQGYWANNIQVQGGQKYSASVKVHYTNGGISNGKALLDLWFIDSTGARISSASRSTSQVSSPYWVQLVSEGFTAPTNAVYLQMSLLVNDAGAGQVATFTQPMLTATEKLQEYTPNDDISAQMSLFKDNWSIGITDNISKITSGIVGNASQMSLISKNVTIDSPNTQINGTAWIQSAMIANGAIGSAQIGDATITSAKIATLDVAKLTGNVSSFIQSNWNGSYGSTQITSNGMTVTSKSPRADLSIRSVFDANGLTMYTPKGATAIRNGETAYISSSSEDIGMMGTVKWAPHPNVDYLMIGLHGWHTTTPGDSSYDQNSDGSNVVYGGDGIGFGISNANGGYDMLMTWDSPLVAGYQGRMSGWHVEDVFTTHLMSYAAGGLKVSSQYSEGERSLHTEGITINNNSRWFGFLDGSGNVGFGTDQTQDVIVLIKGKPYSMYTMLNKLGMLK
ncbi:hypothetical protein [Leuconostoc mesenteroides]|uniref:hypothetical protein n=1 Tax=Leuconostoc mesenteroides TaxID=1245 RepID=UPI003BAD983B